MPPGHSRGREAHRTRRRLPWPWASCVRARAAAAGEVCRTSRMERLRTLPGHARRREARRTRRRLPWPWPSWGRARVRKEAPLPLRCSYKLPPSEVGALSRVARQVERRGPAQQDAGLQRLQLRGCRSRARAPTPALPGATAGRPEDTGLSMKASRSQRSPAKLKIRVPRHR